MTKSEEVDLEIIKGVERITEYLAGKHARTEEEYYRIVATEADREQLQRLLRREKLVRRCSGSTPLERSLLASALESAWLRIAAPELATDAEAYVALMEERLTTARIRARRRPRRLSPPG